MTVKLYCDSDHVKTAGKRSAGNPHAAFDEGGQGKPWPLLYCISVRQAKPDSSSNLKGGYHVNYWLDM